MEILQARVVLIRKHKTVIFVDGIVEGELLQFMASGEVFLHELNVGDIFEAKCQQELNRSGKMIWMIYSIRLVAACRVNASYSTLNMQDSLKLNRIMALLGRDNLSVWRFRSMFIDMISEIMKEYGILCANTSLLMDYRGTSKAMPLNCSGRYVGDKYLKITHEIELKKASILTMSSIYDLSYVYRDVYDTGKRVSEIMMFEGVILGQDISLLVDILKRIIAGAVSLAKKINISYDKRFEEVSMVDVSNNAGIYETYDQGKYKEYMASISKPTILINAPINSPFVKSIDGARKKEVKFIVDGLSSFHGYPDENSYEILDREFRAQMERLSEEEIEGELPLDYLELIQYGAPETISFGMGIDRFLTQFLMKDSIHEVARSLGT